MALAHAIDQFTYKIPDMPVVMKTMTGGQWLGGKAKINRPSNTGVGGRVMERRRL
jgi:hypothetical protein